MSLLLETIKIANKQICLIDYHNQRLNKARGDLLKAHDIWDLSKIISIPNDITSVVYKCRIEYGMVIEKVEFIPYQPKCIGKLFIVNAENLDYRYKYADRQRFVELRSKIPGPDLNDILMVKNGWVTDTSYANIVFFDGEAWVTPHTTLLKGTKRQYYIDNHIIEEQEIRVTDIHRFSKARLINAMLDLENSADIPVDNIL